MNLKYYLRGIGTGLIIAAICFLIASKFNNNSNVPIMETQQLQTNSVIAYSKEETKESTTSAIEKTIEQDTTQQETTQQETTQHDDMALQNIQINQSVTDKIQVDMRDVLYASDAYNLLSESGVIADVSGFIDYMIENDLEKSIRIGIYEFEPNDSYENIAKIITSD